MTTDQVQVPKDPALVLADAFASAMTAVADVGAAMSELLSFLLRGWPFGRLPTEAEMRMIQAVYDEISLHYPEAKSDRTWYLACQVVARCVRDGLVQT